MSVVALTMLGRFGNSAMQYLFARAWAEKYGCEFQCCDWVGNKIFELNDKPITKKGLPRKSELDLKDGDTDFEFYGYAQNQRAMIYTKKQAQGWLKFKPELVSTLEGRRLAGDDARIMAHRRVGDFPGYGYPCLTIGSYFKAFDKFGFDKLEVYFASEEHPWRFPEFSGDVEFLPDFYRLVKANALFRANSTFSWIAAVLGTGRVFSPVIEGLEGGKEHDVEFVEGNWPRLSNLSFCSDLHLPA